MVQGSPVSQSGGFGNRSAIDTGSLDVNLPAGPLAPNHKNRYGVLTHRWTSRKGYMPCPGLDLNQEDRPQNPQATAGIRLKA